MNNNTDETRDVIKKYLELRLEVIEAYINSLQYKKFKKLIFFAFIVVSLAGLGIYYKNKSKERDYYVLYEAYQEQGSFVEVKVQYHYYRSSYDIETKEGLEKLITYLTNKEKKKIFITFYKELKSD
jgi:hypothetical protein